MRHSSPDLTRQCTDEKGLKFDYVLKPGVATTGNAIALLEYLGYAREITQEAKRKDSSP